MTFNIRMLVVKLFVAGLLAALVIKSWPSNGTLDNYTTNFIGPLLELDGESAYDAILVEAWIEFSILFFLIFSTIQKIAIPKMFK